jgi:CHAD domain-containing protein
MPYRLNYEASIETQVRDLTGEELEDAANQLRTAHSEVTGAIHESRKSLKKARALLRLVQPHLGPFYRQENDSLRQIARELSEIRDAGAIVDTLRELRKRYPDQLSGPELDAAEQAILARKQDTENAQRLKETLPNLVEELDEVAARVKDLNVTADGFTAISTGLKNRFRRGRKAMLRARAHPLPENYHEWRKRVKDHWYHARLLEASWTEMMRAYADQLKVLQEWLGDDHNLTVIRDVLLKELDFQEDDPTMTKLLPVIAQEQQKLRERSLALGSRIYAEKARTFVRRLQSLWKAAREAPLELVEAP